jgi:lysozyme family protein
VTDLEESIILESVIRWETPRLTNTSGDLGGWTKYGITWRTYYRWLKRPVPSDLVIRSWPSEVRTAFFHDVEAVMRALSRDTALRIYRAWYVRRPGFSLLRDVELAERCVHWGVMSGPDDPSRALQRVVRVPVDGVVGPVTARAANGVADAAALRDALRAAWETHCRNEARRLPSQQRFLTGWLNRIADVCQ